MCNPFTSAACLASVAKGAAVGSLIPGVGPALGGIVGSGAAGSAAKAAVGAAASGAANAALGGLATTIQDAIGTVAKEMVAWWINLPSPDLTNDPVPATIQSWLLPFTALVAVTSILAAAGRMALTRKVNPLADVGGGLLTLAVVTAVGTAVPTLLLRAGDAYSNYVLNASTGNQFGAKFTALLAFGGVVGPAAQGFLIVLGILGLIAATVQAILLLFRQGAIIILAGTLPLAAAGTMTSLTRPWLRKVTGWMLALIFYKPAAATVYATGFLMISKGLPEEVFVGFAILLLSLVTLPALMRFFTWTTGQAESSAGGGGFLGAVIGGAAAVGALRGYGSMSAVDQSRAVSGALGGSGGQGSGPGGPAGGGSGGQGSGPGGPAGGGSGGQGSGPGGPAGGAGPNPVAGAAATAAGGPASGRSAPGSTPPASAGTSAATGAGTSAAGAGGSSAAAAGPAAAAGAAAGPAAMIVIPAAQAAHGAATRLADGAAPPGSS